MLYPIHGYIDTLNHEVGQGNSKKLKLVTKSKEILLKENNNFNYNSVNFINKILEKVIQDLNGEKISCKNLKIEKSVLKLSPKNQIRHGKIFHEYNLKFKVFPYESAAIVNIQEFNIIAYFKSIIHYTRTDGVLNKKLSLEESQSQLLTIPEHSFQVPMNSCKDYNSFKKTISNAIYKDVSSVITKELKKINLSKWNISLSSISLDIESIVNDNIQVLIA